MVSVPASVVSRATVASSSFPQPTRPATARPARKSFLMTLPPKTNQGATGSFRRSLGSRLHLAGPSAPWLDKVDGNAAPARFDYNRKPMAGQPRPQGCDCSHPVKTDENRAG